MCNKHLPSSEFNRSPKNRDGLHSYCRSCQHDYYLANAEHHGANVRRTTGARQTKMREVVVEAMKDGCVDCGITDIRVLEFDHVRGSKVGGIGAMIRRGRGLDSVRAEIAKCEVRCRNCHALATLSRLGASWHDNFIAISLDSPPGGI